MYYLKQTISIVFIALAAYFLSFFLFWEFIKIYVIFLPEASNQNEAWAFVILLNNLVSNFFCILPLLIFFIMFLLFKFFSFEIKLIIPLFFSLLYSFYLFLGSTFLSNFLFSLNSESFSSVDFYVNLYFLHDQTSFIVFSLILSILFIFSPKLISKN